MNRSDLFSDDDDDDDYDDDYDDDDDDYHQNFWKSQTLNTSCPVCS